MTDGSYLCDVNSTRKELVGETEPSASSSVEQSESTSLSTEEHSDSSSAIYEDLFHIAGANGFHARHIRIAGAAGLAFDLAVFFAAALGSVFGLASALGLALASAFAAGVAAAASCLNGQFSREHDPVFLKVKHTWLFVRPDGLGVLERVGVSGVFLE